MDISQIDAKLLEMCPGSAQLYQRACECLPSGITHDARNLAPFPPYIDRALGAHKWDVDNNRFIDYWMGHGSLVLGHAHPTLVDAVQKQVARGTHFGGCHELEIRWAELICELMPAAQKVRFVGSGTEATQMAMRLSRTFTGKEKTIKFSGHFHGWHDYASPGVVVPFEIPASSGIPKAVLDTIVSLPPNKLELVEERLKQDDIAAIIIEPSGGSWGTIPTTKAFLEGLRQLATQYGVVLVFDEVVTGFRLAPGGAQEFYQVIPDLVCLAKVLAGGLPGGAVAGKQEIMEYLEFKPDPQWNRYKKVAHQGTFNANPLSAAAGIAMLEEILKGDCIKKANELCKLLMKELNQVLQEHDIPGCVYAEGSMFHVALDLPCESNRRGNCDFRCDSQDYTKLTEIAKGAGVNTVRKVMLLEGIDLMRSGGFLSVAHTPEDIAQTKEAFAVAISTLKSLNRG